MEDIVVFLGLKMFDFDLINCSFRNYKYLYLFDTLSDKAFKGTVVNWPLSSLNAELLEITLKVP